MNIFKTTFLAALSILFIGCSSTSEETVTEMYGSLKDGDATKLFRVVTEPKARELTLNAFKKCSVNKALYKTDDFRLAKDCFIEMYGKMNVKNIKVTQTSETEAYAVVTFENNSKNITNKEYLRKLKGKWLIIRYQ
ncbi:MAG: hypothetical protein L3J19_03710 [Sulfurimonas sp.]|nr:hypothetical protein [Sulfurimonas sp.]